MRLAHGWSRRSLCITWIVVFVICLAVLNGYKARILVLHSSRASTPWVQAVDEGMRHALALNRRPVALTRMYLDLDSPASQSLLHQRRAALHRMIDRVDPDLIIAVDDEANALLSPILRNKPVRILYVSIDQTPEAYGYVGLKGVTGSREKLPLAAISDALRSLFPARSPSLAVIGLDTPTGRAEMLQVLQFDWGDAHVKDTKLVATAQAWRDFVGSTNADVLVVLSTRALPERRGTLVAARDLVAWTQAHTTALPIGTQVDFVPNGGILSIAPAPAVYGREAIMDALDWLDLRRTPQAPSAKANAHFQVGLRLSQLTERGFSLPAVYSEAARAVGALYP